jgi:hypothetical protein
MTISNKSLTYDLLLGSPVAAWSNSNIQSKNFTKQRSSRHQTFGFGPFIVHCTLKRRAADA